MSDDVFATDQSGSEGSVLDTLVGEGKKFDNVEALAAGKQKADEHIAQIEQENAELKTKLEQGGNKEATLAELIEAVKAQAKEGAEGDETMSTEDLVKTIKNELAADSEADTKAANRAKGNALVLEKVEGNVEAARALVAERAAAVGMTAAKLAELSETSPIAFAKLIEGDGSTASSGSTTILPGQNTDVLDSGAPVMELDGFKTKAWFDAQKKEKGHVKWLNDRSIQRELARSMNGLGERFNN
jgi:hypothetical protein